MFCDIEGEFLYLSMREMQPEVVVEVGSGSGWSTSWLLQGLVDNGHGLLTACDKNDFLSGIQKPLRDYLHFIQGDALEVTFPSPIDFLLSDASHNAPYVYQFRDKVFPLVRPGGRICVHDMFKAVHPAHGEAISVYQYLDQHDIQCYTPSIVFPVSHARILAARTAVGLGRDFIHPDPKQYNSLCIIEVP